jgi:glycolate oxidase iron-sulfur subunit
MTWPLGFYQRTGLQRLLRRSGLLTLLPQRLQSMERLLPPISREHVDLPPTIPAEGERRLRVGLLLGCVQRVFFGGVNQATARVLAAEGCEVVVPQSQACCGALAEHAGEEREAMDAARRLIDAFEGTGVDLIAVNAAGCGSSMKRYGHLLRGDPEYAERGTAFAAKVRDITEILADLEPRARRGTVDLRAAYHDACHLQHAQAVRVQPRRVLQGIPGIQVREIPESEICCGSAGIYNLLSPEAATELRDRKVRNILSTDADVILSGNPGCLLQIATGLDAAGRPMRIMHVVEVVDQSIQAGKQVR